MVLKICCRLFLVYLGISVAVAGLRGLASCLENSDLEGKEESGKVTKRRSRQGQPRLYTKVILALIFF